MSRNFRGALVGPRGRLGDRRPVAALQGAAVGRLVGQCHAASVLDPT